MEEARRVPWSAETEGGTRRRDGKGRKKIRVPRRGSLSPAIHVPFRHARPVPGPFRGRREAKMGRKRRRDGKDAETRRRAGFGRFRGVSGTFRAVSRPFPVRFPVRPSRSGGGDGSGSVPFGPFSWKKPHSAHSGPFRDLSVRSLFGEDGPGSGETGRKRRERAGKRDGRRSWDK